MKTKTPLLVGLMVIAGAVAFMYTFGSLDQGFDADDTYTVYARFDDATGLVTNSRVMLSGIEVGRLGRIGLDPEMPAMARVELKILNGVALRHGIYDEQRDYWVDGATAVRRQASLIGDFDVAIAPGLRGELLREGDMIPNVVSDTGLSSVIKNLEDASSSIFPKLDAITDDIKSITGGLRQTLGEEGAVADLQRIREDVVVTTANVAKLSAEVREFLAADIYPRGDNIARILDNVERATAAIDGSTVRTLASLERILASVEATTTDVRRFVSAQTAPLETAEPGTVAAAIASLERNMAILEGSLESVRAITARVEQGQGTVGRLLTDDKLISDIESVVADVSEFTSTFGRTEIRMQFRSDYFFGKSAFKNTIDISLHPRPDKFYLFQLVDDPGGLSRLTRRVTASNDPRLPPVLVEDITETSDSLKFTAQLAKRWGFLTFRYGIMESTGGLGLDADLLEDALGFKLDVFEFGRNRYPRTRLLARLEFLTHFFISAGVDDILNGASRDWFVGLGVRFTDNDLKGILPIAPLP